MLRYKNNNGNSNVEGYSIGETFIEVKFWESSKIYRYSYKRAGEKMLKK